LMLHSHYKTKVVQKSTVVLSAPLRLVCFLSQDLAKLSNQKTRVKETAVSCGTWMIRVHYKEYRIDLIRSDRVIDVSFP
ncbi:hypothetical protein, partial [Sporolactobacillus laevolacticus]|uniref:hypothetical protein n=1 Tax=Sporolactobacillus laevolacticus TaxID=33018 RepID=UPI00055C0FFD